MLASILIGLAALIAVSLTSALFLLAHLKGRISRSTALAAAVVTMMLGAAIAGTSALGSGALGPMAVPFGVFLMLGAGINGLLAYQSSKSAPHP